MGVRNYLIEGVSGSGKATVCDELIRRGFHAIHGDRELAFQGDPRTGEPTTGRSHDNHIWHVDRVSALASRRDKPVTFFCGGSRNFHQFIDLFDGVFVLDVDLDTLVHRLDSRPSDEWGAEPDERALVIERHRSKQDIPATGVLIDASLPVNEVVDLILRAAGIHDLKLVL